MTDGVDPPAIDSTPEIWATWDSMRLGNLRLFDDTGLIQLAPMTLIFGKNSSGKTSLLRAPLLMRQLLTEQSPTGEAALSGSLVDFGSFRDAVRDGVLSRDVTLEFAVMTPRERRFNPGGVVSEFMPEDRPLGISTTLHWNKRNGRAQVQALTFTGTQGRTVRAAREGPHAVRLEIPFLNIASVLEGVPEVGLRSLEFLPFGDPTNRRQRESTLLLYSLVDVLQSAFRTMRYVPPIREMPERVYRIDRASPSTSVGTQTITTVARNAAARQRVAAGLRSLEIADDVTLGKSA